MKHINATRIRIAHILLSWNDAIDSTHSREFGFALHDAQQILAELKKGTMSWNAAVKEHSACILSDLVTGDLGWREETDLIAELWLPALVTPIGDVYPEPINSPYGIHIIYRIG